MVDNTTEVETSDGQQQEEGTVEETGTQQADIVDDTPDSGGEGDGKNTDEPEPEKKRDLVDRAELNKVIRERQDAKRRMRELEAELTKIRQATESETQKAQREAREAAIAEIESKYKPLIVRTTAKAELLNAGAPESEVDQMVADFIRLDDVEIDDQGNVSGVDAQVLALKEKYPRLFEKPEEKPKPKPRTAKAADGADKPAAKRKLSAAEQALLMLQGKKL